MVTNLSYIIWSGNMFKYTLHETFSCVIAEAMIGECVLVVSNKQQYLKLLKTAVFCGSDRENR